MKPRAAGDLAADLARAPLLGLLLDFDGTLSDIVPRPADARVRPDALRALRRLATAPGVRIAVISGRPLSDLAARLPCDGLWRVGVHGAEIRTPEGREERLVEAPDLRPKLLGFARQARALAGEFAIVEDKGLAVAVHPRGPDPVAVLRTASRVRACARTLSIHGDLAWQQGKGVIELRAAGATKAAGARAIIARWPSPIALVAIGDDATDEDLFREVASRGGETIKVGPGPTGARRRLASPAAVARFLSRLATSRGRGTSP